MMNFIHLVWKVAMALIVLMMVGLLLTAVSILNSELALREEIGQAIAAMPHVELEPDVATAVSSPTPVTPTQPQPPVVEGVLIAQPTPVVRAGHKLGKTAVPTTSTLSPIFTKEVQHWRPQILQWAAAYELDPNIVATIMQIESCGNPDAISSAGAVGLFQVLPIHFADGETMTNPNTNAERGLNYFVQGLGIHNGDVFLTFAGYNAGHGSVLVHPANWPEETRQYFYWSKGIYEDARTGGLHSPTLTEWLQLRGNSLCIEAAARLGL